jgi:hypothetical protein
VASDQWRVARKNGLRIERRVGLQFFVAGRKF